MGNKVLRITDGTKPVSEMTKEELDAYRKKQEDVHLNFTNMIEDIDLSSDEYRVILVFGECQLVYDKGLFYIEETLNPENRKKITKPKAKEVFVDYYLKRNLKVKDKKKTTKKTTSKKIEPKTRTKKVEPKAKTKVRKIEDEEIER